MAVNDEKILCNKILTNERLLAKNGGSNWAELQHPFILTIKIRNVFWIETIIKSRALTIYQTKRIRGNTQKSLSWNLLLTSSIPIQVWNMQYADNKEKRQVAIVTSLTYVYNKNQQWDPKSFYLADDVAKEKKQYLVSKDSNFYELHVYYYPLWFVVIKIRVDWWWKRHQ